MTPFAPSSEPIGGTHDCGYCGEWVDLKGTYGEAVVDGDEGNIHHLKCYEQEQKNQQWLEAVSELRCTYEHFISDGLFELCGILIAPAEGEEEGGLYPISMSDRTNNSARIPLCGVHLQLALNDLPSQCTRQQLKSLSEYRRFQGWSK